MSLKQTLIDAYNRKDDVAFDAALGVMESRLREASEAEHALSVDVAQAHNVLDILSIPRTI
jgi:hypothetical protein